MNKREGQDYEKIYTKWIGEFERIVEVIGKDRAKEQEFKWLGRFEEVMRDLSCLLDDIVILKKEIG